MEYNSNYKDSFCLARIWFLFLVFTVITILLAFNNIKYYVYYQGNGIVIEKNTIKFEVDLNDLNRVTSNKKIKIKERNFAYTIKSISETLFSLNEPVQVIINIELDNNTNIINNVIEFKIIEKEMTILEYIREKVGIF